MRTILTVALLFISTAAFAQNDYEIDYTCWGAGNRNAMVVSGNNTTYVVRTFDYTPKKKHRVVGFENPGLPGTTFIRIRMNGVTQTIDVEVLSRIRYGYSDLSAPSFCRRIAQGEI